MSKKKNWTIVLEAIFTGAQLEARAGSTPVDEYQKGSKAFEEAAGQYGKAVEKYSSAVALLEKMRTAKNAQLDAVRIETLELVQARIEHARSRQSYWNDQTRKLKEAE